MHAVDGMGAVMGVREGLASMAYERRGERRMGGIAKRGRRVSAMRSERSQARVTMTWNMGGMEQAGDAQVLEIDMQDCDL